MLLYAFLCLTLVHHCKAIFTTGLIALTIMAPSTIVTTGPILSGIAGTAGGTTAAAVVCGVTSCVATQVRTFITASAVATGMTAACASAGAAIGVAALVAPPFAIAVGTLDAERWDCYYKLIHPTPEEKEMYRKGMPIGHMIRHPNVKNYTSLEGSGFSISNIFGETFYVKYFLHRETNEILAHVF